MRKAARFAVAAAVAAVLACKGEGGPRPSAIEPDHGPADVPVRVTIRGSAFQPRVVTDFEQPGASSLDARFTARLGEVFLRDVELTADGTLTATVPAGLAAGVHDLTVTRPDGREGSLGAAYRALGAGELADVVASYRVEVTGKPPYQAFRPFEVTITALDSAGEVAADFGGWVSLEDLTGTAAPARAGLFEAGRWTGQVEVRLGVPADALTASDASGHRGSSTHFAVLPGAIARLDFTPSPTGQFTAGTCSTPMEIGLLDAFGHPTLAPAPLTLSIDAGPDAALYSDDACTVALDPTVPAYGAGLSFRFRTPHAGAIALQATAPGVEVGLASPVDIVPAAMAALAFATPPATAGVGACGSAVVEVRDPFGNPVPAAGLVVTLAAAPAGSLQLYAGLGCTDAGASAAAVDARATFSFRAAEAGSFTLTASATGVAPATQDGSIQ